MLDGVEESLNTILFLQYAEIFKFLPWAGFPGNYSSLSKLKNDRGRQFVRVDDHGLHLVWKNTIQYIKPLPSCFGADTLDFDRMGPCCRGIFHSYTKLIRTEFDFDLAIEERLLPPIFKRRDGWNRWKQHIKRYDAIEFPQLPGHIDAWAREQQLLMSCHRRYQYGSLRLPRLNYIMWFIRPNKRNYFHNTEDPMSVFWQKYGGFLVLVLGYVSVALSAMQVVLRASSPPALDQVPGWVGTSFKWFAFGIIFLLLGQIPIYVLGSLFWILTNSALSTTFISVLLGDWRRAPHHQ